MEVRIRLIWVVAAMAAAMVFYAARAAQRAHRNLVTLDVRNMDVRKVVRKVEWQTWETVYVAQDVKGMVTLNVRNAPLDEVLNLIGGQVAARAAHVFPIYRSKSSLRAFQSLMQRGTAEWAEANVWTNFSTTDFGLGGGRFGPGFEAFNSGSKLINLSLKDKEASLAALTLAAATHAQVVPEDGLDAALTLQIQQATRDSAIAQFAHALQAKWREFYSLRAMPTDFARRRNDDSESMQERRTQRLAARLEALTPEQRAQMEEMRNLSPEERQARMQARMQDPAVQQQMIDRALNTIRTSTPEQLVERKRQRMQMAQNGQRPGAGQGSRPGPQ